MSEPARGTARRPRRRPLALLPAMFVAAALADGDTDRGEALYANHCGGCHDQAVHTRDARRVGSREELRGWVAAWSAHAELDWRDEEIESVTSYLSRRLYRFTR